MNSATRVKLLVADSDRKMRELIRTNLLSDDIEILEADTAWGCLKLACKEDLDLIILDPDLPDHDGWETLLLMRLFGVLLNAEIIVTSPDLPSSTNLRKSRATDFLKKPFDVRHLVQLVDRAVAGRRGFGIEGSGFGR